jgi:hypothetical protein
LLATRPRNGTVTPVAALWAFGANLAAFTGEPLWANGAYLATQANGANLTLGTGIALDTLNAGQPLLASNAPRPNRTNLATFATRAGDNAIAPVARYRQPLQLQQPIGNDAERIPDRLKRALRFLRGLAPAGKVEHRLIGHKPTPTCS